MGRNYVFSTLNWLPTLYKNSESGVYVLYRQEMDRISSNRLLEKLEFLMLTVFLLLTMVVEYCVRFGGGGGGYTLTHLTVSHITD